MGLFLFHLTCCPLTFILMFEWIAHGFVELKAKEISNHKIWDGTVKP